MKVLVVDDNPLTAMVIAGALKSHNFDAVVAYSGIDALEFLAQHPEVQLIVVDVMMPEMTGYELVGKLREEPYWKDVPVVVCTALANVETVDRIASLGCRHYVLKPVTEEQLLLKVRQALETGTPILEHEDRTLEKVGMDAATYERTVVAFATMLDSRIQELGDLLGSYKSGGISLEITDVKEGAVLLGAKRLSKLLAHFPRVGEPGKTSPAKSDWMVLLREMKALRQTLEPRNMIQFSI